MGNLLTRENDQNQSLQNQLKNLSDRVTEIDRNSDGTITKDEFTLWQSEQKILLENLRISIIQQKDQEYHEQLALLKKELEATKKINHDLQQSLHQLTHESITVSTLTTTHENPNILDQSPGTNNLFGEVSKLRIQEAVDKMIANQNINIGYLPDIVERQLYKNMFNILLNLLDELSDGVSIKVLGHEITMKMKAIE
jgi:heme oxygenase